MREAKIRRDYVAGELAAMRVPQLELLVAAPAETLKTVGDRWRASRVDVADATAITHRANMGRVLRVLGDKRVYAITAQDVAQFVAHLHTGGAARENIRKTLAIVLDFAAVIPNPARDRVAVKLPREDPVEVNPPTAKHVLAVHGILTRPLRLPLLVLDATGMGVGELAGMTWATSTSRRAAGASVRPSRRYAEPAGSPSILDVFQAVTDTVPREDRNLDAPVFAGVRHRPLPDRDLEGLQGGRRTGVLAARPEASAGDALALAGRPDRRRGGMARALTVRASGDLRVCDARRP